jgi:predicted ATPase
MEAWNPVIARGGAMDDARPGGLYLSAYMELIGLEVEGYAGFTKQYIPLRNRVHLLVGKNDAGKTALLHACNLFNGQEFLKYGEKAPVRFVFYQEQQAGPEHNPGFIVDQMQRPDYSQEYLVRVDWQVSGVNSLALDRVDLLQPDGVLLPVVHRTGPHLNTWERVFYRQAGGQLHRIGNAGQPQGYQEHGLKQALDSLKVTSYIDPHRKMAEVMPSAESNAMPTSGEGLASYLQTLRGRDPDRFQEVEDAFLRCFPGYSRVISPLSGSNVGVSLGERKTKRQIPIKQCGTGVEQVLILLTCILGTSERRMFLLDEPQDFLHPFLERKLMEIIQNSQHSFLIATHSATMINSVQAEQITYIEKPGTGYLEYARSRPNTGEMLRHLGYRNSDFLFFDGIVFVEGLSDKDIFPILMAKADTAKWSKLRDVCFCDLGGTRDYEKFDDMEDDLVTQEKLISALHRSGISHIYVFDGDKRVSESRLKGFRPAGRLLDHCFLERSEIENYLLDDVAVSAAINAECEERGLETRTTPDDVGQKINKLLATTRESNEKLFEFLFKKKPKEGGERASVQGSRLLEKVYGNFKLSYNKRRTGARIADHLEMDDATRAELSTLLDKISAVVVAS